MGEIVTDESHPLMRPFEDQSKLESYIETACLSGNYTRLDELLNSPLPHQKFKSSILFSLINKLKENRNFDENRQLNFHFHLCFERLLGDTRIDVNCTDGQGNTPLHYTVEYKWDKLTKLLLEHSAYIGLKNSNGKLPIDGINPKILHEFFDAQITSNYNNHTRIDNHYEINLNYSFLIKKPNEQNKFSQNTNQFYPIEFISQTDYLRDLILHPLVRYLIWTKSEALAYLFIWNGFTFLVSLLTIIYITFFKMAQTKDQPEFIIILTLIATWICIFINLTRLVFKIWDFKNSNMTIRVYAIWKLIPGLKYLSIAVLLVVVLCIDDDDLRKTLTAICILIIAIDMNQILTTMPKLQRMSIHFLMLKKITYTFLNVLLFYLIILFAFSLSFYVLDSKSTDHNNKISRLSQFCMRVIGMMIGELNLEFDSHLVFYYILMLIFIFMITIVLINLLNGLAISDVSEIRLQAKLIYLQYRVQLIASCDNFFSNYPLLRKIIFHLTSFTRFSCLKRCFRVEIALCRYVTEIKLRPDKNLSIITNMLRPIEPDDVDVIEWNKIKKNILKELVDHFQYKLEVKDQINKEDELKNMMKDINQKLDMLIL